MKRLIPILIIISTVLVACTPKAPPPPTTEEMEHMLEEKYEEEFTVTSQTETFGENSFTGYTAYPNARPEFEFHAYEYSKISNIQPLEPRFITYTVDNYDELLFLEDFNEVFEDKYNQYAYKSFPVNQPDDHLYSYQDYTDIHFIFIELDIDEIDDFYKDLSGYMMSAEKNNILKIEYYDNWTSVMQPEIFIYLYYIDDNKLYNEFFSIFTALTFAIELDKSDPCSVFTYDYVKDKFSTKDEITAKRDLYFSPDDEFVLNILKNHPEVMENYNREE
ncbi:MAG: hypothetical protein R3Y24_02745 [Eubacteriales bacterium]